MAITTDHNNATFLKNCNKRCPFHEKWNVSLVTLRIKIQISNGKKIEDNPLIEKDGIIASALTHSEI
jgi:hypothetical protein